MIFFNLTNSVDPYVMRHFVAFHLGLHCLPKYIFVGIQATKGLIGASYHHTSVAHLVECGLCDQEQRSR